MITHQICWVTTAQTEQELKGFRPQNKKIADNELRPPLPKRLCCKTLRPKDKSNPRQMLNIECAGTKMKLQATSSVVPQQETLSNNSSDRQSKSKFSRHSKVLVNYYRTVLFTKLSLALLIKKLSRNQIATGSSH